MSHNAVMRVQLVGRFAARLPDGRRAGPWARPSARRLFQLLCLRPGYRVGREEVAELLFPDLAPARAANAVAKALSMARAALGTAAQVGPDGRDTAILMADRMSIWINPGLAVAIDLHSLESDLRAALEVAPGIDRDAALVSALASDEALLPEEPYADWAQAAREGLETLRQRARITLARDRAQGDGSSAPESVIEAWNAVVVHEPTNEAAALGLMRAYASSGRRDRAIRAYLRCASALREQLAVAPGTDTERAYAELLGETRTREIVHASPAEWVAGRRLVGRQEIVRRVRRRLAATPGGRGPTLLVTGPAGIGKSHLVHTVAWEVERAGWRTLLGAALPEDAGVPFASLRSALAPLAAESIEPLPSVLAATFAHDGDTETPPDLSGGGIMLAQLAAELGDLLDRASRQTPVLLVLDDLGWADAGQQRVVRRLASRTGRRRWAILAAARSDEPGVPLPALGTAADTIALPPLSEGATRSAAREALLADGTRLPARRLVAAVDRSGGNPFFAIELARAAAHQPAPASTSTETLERPASGRPAEVPSPIVTLLRRRLDGLTPGARTILSLSALAGADASYELLLAAANRLNGMEEGASAGALDELIAARLVVEVGDRLALVHPLLRDAAASLVNAVRRSAIHTAIADELERLDVASDHGAAEAVAAHRLAAFGAAHLRSTARAAAVAGFAAGQHARRVYADDVAIWLLTGALDAFDVLAAPERTALGRDATAAWLTIGHTLLDRDNPARAETAYRHALETAVYDDDRARAWSALAGLPYRTGDLMAALAIYEAGMQALSGDSPHAHARLESDAAWCLLRLGRSDEGLAILERVAPVLADAPETHIRCRVQDRLAIALDAAGRRDEALTAFAAGITDATDHSDDRELMVLTMHRAPVLAQLGRHDEALADIGRAASIADQTHDRYSRAVVHWTAADVHEARGDLAAAVAERDGEIVILLAIDNQRNLAIAQAHRASLLDRLGRTAEAEIARGASAVALARVGDPDLAAELGTTPASLPDQPRPGNDLGTATT